MVTIVAITKSIATRSASNPLDELAKRVESAVDRTEIKVRCAATHAPAKPEPVEAAALA